jgi:hypothetical protein
MNTGQSIAINARVQNLESILIVVPTGGVSMFNTDASRAEILLDAVEGTP